MILKVDGLKDYNGFYVTLALAHDEFDTDLKAITVGPIYESEAHLLDSFVRMVDNAAKLKKPLKEITGAMEWLNGDPTVKAFDTVCFRLDLLGKMQEAGFKKTAIVAKYGVVYKCGEKISRVSVEDTHQKGMTIEYK
jgi:hypothetical protein